MQNSGACCDKLQLHSKDKEFSHRCLIQNRELLKNLIRYSTIDLSKYIGDFLFFMKEGEEEEPVIHNEAAVFRWESNKLGLVFYSVKLN